MQTTIDVVSLHQGGVENVVASSGTSLTTEQIQLIRRYTDNLTLLFDGDAAGQRAALRVFSVFNLGLPCELSLLQHITHKTIGDVLIRFGKPIPCEIEK